MGQLAFAEGALIKAELNEWPVVYGANLVENTPYLAADRVQLADAVETMLHALEIEVEDLERSVDRFGPPIES